MHVQMLCSDLFDSLGAKQLPNLFDGPVRASYDNLEAEEREWPSHI